MYNKDKPNKFRVDFFILSDTEMLHIPYLDVYQGKNAANIDIDESVRAFPTTQKAVLNAVIRAGLSNDPQGSRVIAMDNRYAAPELFVVLLEIHDIYASGTTRSNRIGYPKDDERLTVPRGAERGEFKMVVDWSNQLAAIEWKDSKVVRMLSSTLTPGVDVVQRCVGRDILNVPCPRMVIKYQTHMNAIDQGDQSRMHGGGWANKGHFKKWYKKAFHGVLDIMLLQSWISWRLAVSEHASQAATNVAMGAVKWKASLKKEEFNVLVAVEMMTYIDQDAGDAEQAAGNVIQNAQDALGSYEEGHHPVPLPSTGPNRQRV